MTGYLLEDINVSIALRILGPIRACVNDSKSYPIGTQNRPASYVLDGRGASAHELYEAAQKELARRQGKTERPA